jgi:hypothetical protein
MTTTVPTQRPSMGGPDDDYDEDGVWCPTKEELTAYVNEGLARLGITREELARQAEDDWFEPSVGGTYWMMIRYLGA